MHAPLPAGEFRSLLKAWGVVWEHSGVRGSPSYTSVAQGQGRKRVLGGVGGAEDATLVFLICGR